MSLGDSRAEPRYIVNYVTPEGEQYQHEAELIQPAVGNGVELADTGKRYRITDVWIITEKHGMLTHGINAFIEPVTDEDDTPANVFPAYYRHSGE